MQAWGPGGCGRYPLTAQLSGLMQAGVSFCKGYPFATQLSDPMQAWSQVLQNVPIDCPTILSYAGWEPDVAKSTHVLPFRSDASLESRI